MGLGLGPGKEPENLTSNWGADYMEYPTTSVTEEGWSTEQESTGLGICGVGPGTPNWAKVHLPNGAIA